MCGQIPVVFHFLHAVLIAHYDQQNALALDEHASQIIVFEKCPLDQSLQVTSYKLQVTSLLLSDAQNDTGSDWALKFLGQEPTIA